MLARRLKPDFVRSAFGEMLGRPFDLGARVFKRIGDSIAV